MTIIRPDIGLLTAKCIDLSLLIDYSTYFKELSIQSGVRLIEVLINRKLPNTIYFSVRVRLIEQSAEQGFVIKGHIRRSFRDPAQCPLNRGCPLNWGSASQRFHCIHLSGFEDVLCCSDFLRACLYGGGGPQIGEVTCGGLPHLSCKCNQIKMRDHVDKRVTHQSGLPHLPGVPSRHVNRP